MDADWAQAWIAGVAIIASALIAVWVPYREREARRREDNRRRLQVVTTRSPPAALQVEFQYQPEFTHVGLFAEVNLLAPANTTLHGMRPLTNPAPIAGRFMRYRQDSAFVQGRGRIPLVRLGADGLFEGAMIIVPAYTETASREQITKARIAVVVRTEAGEILLQVTLDITPIDEARSFWEAAESPSPPV